MRRAKAGDFLKFCWDLEVQRHASFYPKARTHLILSDAALSIRPGKSPFDRSAVNLSKRPYTFAAKVTRMAHRRNTMDNEAYVTTTHYEIYHFIHI